MRINVYSQELTSEVITGAKVSNTGREYNFVQLILHSSERLHHPPEDDDRSAVTFWMPKSGERCYTMAVAFREIAEAFADAARKRGFTYHNYSAEQVAEARRLNQLAGEERDA